MSDQMEIVAEERTITGKKVKQPRSQGLVPALLFGHNVESIPIQAKRDDPGHLAHQPRLERERVVCILL